MAGYVNPFAEWQGGANQFSNWVQGPDPNNARPSSWYDTYEGTTGLGALGANITRSWNRNRANAFSSWLNDNYTRLQNEYNYAAGQQGNSNLNWMDWLAQRTGNIMTDYGTSAPVEQGYRPWDFINLRTRWQR